jgi:hypothetical protein
MMKQTISKRFPRIGLLQIAVILLAVITALIHLDLGVRFLMIGEGGPLPIMWILNFVGYIVLVTALYLPPLQGIQSITRWVLIAYTVLTVILWYLIGISHANLEAYVDKLVEVVLIILLLVDAFWPRLRTA